jgi:tRNA threonylcarbamoyladenosine biosynthesis protein TsaE
MTVFLPDEVATLAFAARFYRALPPACVIYLHGPLGAGKTAFVRGCLHAAGHTGAVKSPTFTLVEEYAPDGRAWFHFDLYRLSDPEELEFLGIRDYFGPNTLCFIEWAERGAGILPAPDLELELAIDGAGRRLTLSAVSGAGRSVLDKLAE